jgi:hypothetical protein
MAREIRSAYSTRRYVRVRGPFDADHLDVSMTPVLIYDLNLGGGFVKFSEERPTAATLTLKIDLPIEGPITVNAEAVYRDVTGVAVRFVHMDGPTTARLARNIEAFMVRGS